MNLVVFGLTITSSWGNGHATTYRALLRDFAARGHRVTFLEHDQAWYAAHRDLEHLPGVDIHLYPDRSALEAAHTEMVREADAVILGSYVPEAIDLARWIHETARGLVAFYDIDTPVTLAALENGTCTYLDAAAIPRFDIYLSFTGGPTLERLRREWGAFRAEALYCSVDLKNYHPVAAVGRRWELGYLGTYAADRQPALTQLLCEPAAALPARSFVVAGSQYPAGVTWPPNVERIEHLPPGEHAPFYGAQRFTLNVTRRAMIAAGYSPSVRLFEAAACGAPMITDAWEGLEEFFEPGSEILVARSSGDVVDILSVLPEREAAAISARALARVQSEHSSAQRAARLERLLTGVPAATV